jgi:hypothetical protein
MESLADKSSGYKSNTRRLVHFLKIFLMFNYFIIPVYPVKPPLPAIGGNEGCAVVIKVSNIIILS